MAKILLSDIDWSVFWGSFWGVIGPAVATLLMSAAAYLKAKAAAITGQHNKDALAENTHYTVATKNSVESFGTQAAKAAMDAKTAAILVSNKVDNIAETVKNGIESKPSGNSA